MLKEPACQYIYIYEETRRPLCSVVKNPPANAGGIRDMDSIFGSGGSPRGGHGNPLQYSRTEEPGGQFMVQELDTTEVT